MTFMTIKEQSCEGDLRRRFDEAVFLIGAGLAEKDALYEKDTNTYLYSQCFRRGLNAFAALCFEHAGDKAAELLAGLSESRFIREYCTVDVARWTDGWTDESRAVIAQSDTATFGPLVRVDGDIFVLTDDCLDLVDGAEDDAIGAYHERKVYEYLRAGSQEQYVMGRGFLIKNPILSFDDYVAAKTGRCIPDSGLIGCEISSAADLEWLRELVEIAYEPIPDEMRVCPRCGWTMSKRGLQVRCVSPSCRDSVSEYEGLEEVPHNSFRLARGVMHYIALPGKLELDIAQMSHELGISYELWPLKDACDVLIVSPDGKTLAIDAKAYGSAYRLANEIRDDMTADVLGADEVVYAIPNEAESEHPGYSDICNQALASRDGYSCCTLKNLKNRMSKNFKETR